MNSVVIKYWKFLNYIFFLVRPLKKHFPHNFLPHWSFCFWQRRPRCHAKLSEKGTASAVFSKSPPFGDLKCFSRKDVQHSVSKGMSKKKKKSNREPWIWKSSRYGGWDAWVETKNKRHRAAGRTGSPTMTTLDIHWRVGDFYRDPRIYFFLFKPKREGGSWAKWGPPQCLHQSCGLCFMSSERQPKCLQECGEFPSPVFPKPGLFFVFFQRTWGKRGKPSKLASVD